MSDQRLYTTKPRFRRRLWEVQLRWCRTNKCAGMFRDESKDVAHAMAAAAKEAINGGAK